VLGAAVAEWVPGLSLAEAVADGMLKPLAAARALQPLAAAAEAAHRHGHVLGCDHPQRRGSAAPEPINYAQYRTFWLIADS